MPEELRQCSELNSGLAINSIDLGPVKLIKISGTICVYYRKDIKIWFPELLEGKE